MRNNVKYKLQPPSDVTKQRILEVKFYLFMESFLLRVGENTTFKTDILGVLSNTLNMNTAALLAILNTLAHPMYKPTQKEITVATNIMGIPVRTVTNQKLVSNGNYYRILQDYIDEGEPVMFPKLTDDMRDQIQLFFDHASGIFEYVSYVVKGEIR